MEAENRMWNRKATFEWTSMSRQDRSIVLEKPAASSDVRNKANNKVLIQKRGEKAKLDRVLLNKGQQMVIFDCCQAGFNSLQFTTADSPCVLPYSVTDASRQPFFADTGTS